MIERRALHDPDPGVYIRPVRLIDVEPLHAACWSDRPMRWVYELVSRARQQALQGRGLGVVVTTNDRHTLIAYGQVTLWLRAAEISDLMVAAPYRSQGIGTTMIQYLVRVARDMHASKVEIGAMMENTRALALYRRLGFIDFKQVVLGKDRVQYLLLPLKESS